MEEIDVEQMEQNHENEKYRQEMVKQIIKQRKETDKLPKEDKKAKIKKAIEGFKKTKAVSEKVIRTPKIKINKKEDEEVFNSFKSSIYEVLTVPMKIPEKKPKLKKKLMDSEYCENYLKNGLYDKYLRFMNPNVKFALVYGYHYTNTLFELDEAPKVVNIKDEK